MASALKIVQKFFPEITKVRDSKKNVRIKVSRHDANSATVRNHKACAVAVACKREFHADGIIMSINTAYIIKDGVATRYKVPSSIAREVVSFDRSGTFSIGEYELKAPSKSALIGQQRGNLQGSQLKPNGGLAKRFIHHTDGIRSALGSSDAV